MKQKADQEDVPFGDKDEMYRRIPAVKRINDIIMENTDAKLAAGVLPNMGTDAERFCRKVGLQVLYCGTHSETLSNRQLWIRDCDKVFGDKM